MGEWFRIAAGGEARERERVRVRSQRGIGKITGVAFFLGWYRRRGFVYGSAPVGEEGDMERGDAAVECDYECGSGVDGGYSIHGAILSPSLSLSFMYIN